MKYLIVDREHTYPVIKIDKHTADIFGIPYEDTRLNIVTRGPWNIPVSCKGLALHTKFMNGFAKKTTIFGQRTMSDVKNLGYDLEGRVSISGKRYTCFTSSQLFEVEGKLISVGVIFVRYKTNAL